MSNVFAYKMARFFITSLFLQVCFSQNIFAQDQANKIKSIFGYAKSYKYSNVFIYKIKQETITELNAANVNAVTFPNWNELFPNSIKVDAKITVNNKDKVLEEMRGVYKEILGPEKFNLIVGDKINSLVKIATKSYRDELLNWVIKEEFNKLDTGGDEEDDGDSGEDKGSKGANEEDDPLTKFKKKNVAQYAFATQFVKNMSGKIADAYIITDRANVEDSTNIIGMLVFKNSHFMRLENVNSFEDIPEFVKNRNEFDSEISDPNDIGIYVRKELAKKNISTSNLDNYLLEIIKQNGALNVTAQLQGITDGNLDFLPKKYGVSNPVSEDSVQMFIRISEGQPFDYTEGGNELTIGLFDVIRYRYFGDRKAQGIDSEQANEGEAANIFQNYNQNLPVFGVELKYGLSEINYPSLWSERMTLSVMWQSNKLGLILPTNGWSQLSKDFFNMERRLTNAGIGLYGSFDLPIKLLNQGGVFNFNGSYVFGDAKTNQINSIIQIPGRTSDGADSSYSTSLNLSYLPRFHAQAHYSFAINVDNYTFFRFKLGATAFLMQRYADLSKNVGKDAQTGRDIIESSNRKIDQYSYSDLSVLNRFDNNQIIAMSSVQASELIAGLSGRIEFMTNTEEQTVPWGGAVQYFDGAISGDIWLQVPIIGFDRYNNVNEAETDGENLGEQVKNDDNIFALSLRAQAQFFQTVFRDPRAWELETVAIPSLQLLINF